MTGPTSGRLGSYGTRRVWGVAVLVAVILTVLGTPRTAWAHNALIGTTPEDGTTVASAPDAIVLTFHEPAIATGTKVLVIGPDGSATSGDPSLVDNTVRQPLRPQLPAGEYTVDWRVTSADGHPVNGTFTFGVRSESQAPSSPPPSPSQTPSASQTPSTSQTSDGGDDGAGDVSPWWWLLASVPVGLAAVLGWRFSRR